MTNYSHTDANSSHATTANHPFGKVLAKGTSLDITTEMFTGLLFAGLLGGGIMIGALFLSNSIRADSVTQMPGIFGMPGPTITDQKGLQFANFVFWGGAGGAAVIVFLTVLFNWRVCQTEITVYENGVIGTGAGKSFNTDFALHSFQLTWDKVTSVDASGTVATGKTVIIHASGAQYKCYVQNPSEIQGIIVSQQQKRT